MKETVNLKKIEFTSLTNKKVVTSFTGNQVTSDVGLSIKQFDEKELTANRFVLPILKEDRWKFLSRLGD